MARGNVVKKTGEDQFAIVKSLLSQERTVKNFEDVIGPKAPQFMASVLNVMSASDKLKQCAATSILGAAMVAATLDLPVDPNIGFAAIVPYRVKNEYRAQFQIQYKGMIQLAIRSGLYENMNVASVYADELKGYNPITGECEFVEDFSACTMRNEGKPENIVGYFAWFKLLSGFRKELYMTKQEILNHAMKYSSAFKYDINNGYTSSLWSTDFEAMAQKTVIKLLLKKYGVLSIQMQQAVTDDQKVFDAKGDSAYADNGEIIEDVASNPMADLVDGIINDDTAEAETVEKETEES